MRKWKEVGGEDQAVVGVRIGSRLCCKILTPCARWAARHRSNRGGESRRFSGATSNALLTQEETLEVALTPIGSSGHRSGPIGAMGAGQLWTGLSNFVNSAAMHIEVVFLC